MFFQFPLLGSEVNKMEAITEKAKNFQFPLLGSEKLRKLEEEHKKKTFNSLYWVRMKLLLLLP